MIEGPTATMDCSEGNGKLQSRLVTRAADCAKRKSTQSKEIGKEQRRGKDLTTAAVVAVVNAQREIATAGHGETGAGADDSTPLHSEHD